MTINDLPARLRNMGIQMNDGTHQTVVLSESKMSALANVVSPIMDRDDQKKKGA